MLTPFTVLIRMQMPKSREAFSSLSLNDSKTGYKLQVTGNETCNLELVTKNFVFDISFEIAKVFL